MATNEEKKANAAEAYSWLEAYVQAGFTRDETIRIIVAWNSRPETPTAAISPDLAELMAKTRLIADQTLQHLHDDGGE